MKEILEIVGIVFVSHGMWDFIKTVYLQKSKKKKPYDAMLLAIGRDRLLFLCKRYLAKGSIPDDEYHSFLEMGDAYLEMKGNSAVKHMFEKAEKLPLEIEKES